MLDKIKKNIFIALAIAIVIYLVFIIYADFSEIRSIVIKIEWHYFIFILFISFLTFLIKYIKWEYGLYLIKIKISKIHSFQIFLSSLTMSITPGKIGDLLKSYLLKNSDSIPVSQSSPIILVERITEFLSLLFICFIGIALFEDWLLLLILITIALVLITLIFANEKLSNIVLQNLLKIKFLKKHINNIAQALSHARQLLKPKSFLIMMFISFAAWIVEGFILYLILQYLDVGLSFSTSFMIYRLIKLLFFLISFWYSPLRE